MEVVEVVAIYINDPGRLGTKITSDYSAKMRKGKSIVTLLN